MGFWLRRVGAARCVPAAPATRRDRSEQERGRRTDGEREKAGAAPFSAAAPVPPPRRGGDRAGRGGETCGRKTGGRPQLVAAVIGGRAVGANPRRWPCAAWARANFLTPVLCAWCGTGQGGFSALLCRGSRRAPAAVSGSCGTRAGGDGCRGRRLVRGVGGVRVRPGRGGGPRSGAPPVAGDTPEPLRRVACGTWR